MDTGLLDARSRKPHIDTLTDEHKVVVNKITPNMCKQKNITNLVGDKSFLNQKQMTVGKRSSRMFVMFAQSGVDLAVIPLPLFLGVFYCNFTRPGWAVILHLMSSNHLLELSRMRFLRREGKTDGFCIGSELLQNCDMPKPSRAMLITLGD